MYTADLRTFEENITMLLRLKSYLKMLTITPLLLLLKKPIFTIVCNVHCYFFYISSIAFVLHQFF